MNDREHGSIADKAVGHHDVLAQNSFKLCPKFEDVCFALLISIIAFELHAVEGVLIEGGGEHQEFCGRVHVCALPSGNDPTETNFHCLVGGTNV